MIVIFVIYITLVSTSCDMLVNFKLEVGVLILFGHICIMYEWFSVDKIMRQSAMPIGRLRDISALDFMNLLDISALYMGHYFTDV